MTSQPSSLSTDIPAPPSEAVPLMVEEHLNNFHILPSPWMRQLLFALPIGIILWFVIGLLRLPSNVSPDYFLLFSFLCVVIDLFFMRELFEQTPEVLLGLWKRGIFSSRSDRSERTPKLNVESEFINHLKTFEKSLRSPLAHLVGVLFALLSIGTTYIVLNEIQAGRNPFTQSIIDQLVGNYRFLYLPIGYFMGLLAWEVFTIAYFIYRLGTDFDLKIQVTHPDQCGGLKPLGDLCLLIALLLVVPTIFYSIYGFYNVLFSSLTKPDPALAVYQTWSGIFRFFVFILAIATLLAFFQPVYSIHRQMQQHKLSIADELNQLSQIIDEIDQHLRQQASFISVDEGNQALARLKLLRQVYEDNSHFPTWPFQWQTIMRFSTAQLVPILSLIGTSAPVMDKIQKLLGLVPK